MLVLRKKHFFIIAHLLFDSFSFVYWHYFVLWPVNRDHYLSNFLLILGAPQQYPSLLLRKVLLECHPYQIHIVLHTCYNIHDILFARQYLFITFSTHGIHYSIHLFFLFSRLWFQNFWECFLYCTRV